MSPKSMTVDEVVQNKIIVGKAALLASATASGPVGSEALAYCFLRNEETVQKELPPSSRLSLCMPFSHDESMASYQVPAAIGC